MDIIQSIQYYIQNNDIENAYKIIIENEKDYMNNHEYLNLTGMLCFKIQEYNSAINFYKKAINIKEDYLDGYFNLVYTYLMLGEKIKATLYAGISLRYTDNDINYINDIKSLYENEFLKNEYFNILENVKNNNLIKKENVNLFKYIAYKFKDIDMRYTEFLSERNVSDNWAYIESDIVITSREILKISDFVNLSKNKAFDIITSINEDYASIIKELAHHGFEKVNVLYPINGVLELFKVNNEAIY